MVQVPPHAFTPLHVHCGDCGSTFKVLRGATVTVSAPPRYCIWCSSSNLTVDQVDTEETAIIALAAKYDLPVVLFQRIFAVWEQNGHYQHFDDFMTAPANVAQVAALRIAFTLQQGVTANA